MIDEQLSVFLDEESNIVEIKQSIRALRGDPEYRIVWQRHLWIREALREDAQVPAPDVGFADRVTAALNAGNAGQSNVVPMARKRRAPHWWQGAAGLAAAASVAAATVLVIQPFHTPIASMPAQPVRVANATLNGDGAGSAQNPATVASVSHSGRVQARRMAPDHWTVSSPAVAEQLNNYLLEHSGLATRYGMSGARPSLVRVATYGWSRGR